MTGTNDLKNEEMSESEILELYKLEYIEENRKYYQINRQLWLKLRQPTHHDIQFRLQKSQQVSKLLYDKEFDV